MVAVLKIKFTATARERMELIMWEPRCSGGEELLEPPGLPVSANPHPTQGTYRGASGPLWSRQTRLSSFALRVKKKEGSILRLFLFLAAWASWCDIDTSQSLPPGTGVHFRAESMPTTLSPGLLHPDFPGTVLVPRFVLRQGVRAPLCILRTVLVWLRNHTETLVINGFLPTHGTTSRQLLITAFYRWDSEAQRSSDITGFIHGQASPNPTAAVPTARGPQFTHFFSIPSSLNYKDVMGTPWLFKILHRQKLGIAMNKNQ